MALALASLLRLAGQTPAWAGAWKAPSALWTPQVELQWFDAIILLTIGANCATMAWESPLDEMLHPEGTWKSSFIGVCEWAYLGIFTFELLTKVLAYGFLWHREAYLRDAWCQLDFVVVTLAWRRVDTPPIHSAMIAPATHPVAPPACSMGGCRAGPPAQAAVTASWNAAARARLRLHTIKSS